MQRYAHTYNVQYWTCLEMNFLCMLRPWFTLTGNIVTTQAFDTLWSKRLHISHKPGVGPNTYTSPPYGACTLLTHFNIHRHTQNSNQTSIISSLIWSASDPTSPLIWCVSNVKMSQTNQEQVVLSMHTQTNTHGTCTYSAYHKIMHCTYMYHKVRQKRYWEWEKRWWH